MDYQEIAIKKFEEGYNCAQAVACCYAKELGISEELIYRMLEGFGGGVAHSGHLCGTISGITLVKSYMDCPDMSAPGTTKEATYAKLQPLLKQFEQVIGNANCRDILAHGDETLVHGKKSCCRECVKTACNLLDHELVKG